jgi:hypothetical protein
VTDVSSRPMPTPDLANLLKRPRRAPAETPSDASDSNAVTALQVIAPDETEFQAPAPEAIPPKEAAAPRSESDESVRERKQRQPKSTAEMVSPDSQTSGRQYFRIKSIYLPRSMHQRLGQEAVSRQTTRTALILTAINNTHSRLGSYLAKDGGSADGSGVDDLFDIPQHRKDAEPAVQTTIRITDRQHQAIETLVEKHGTNRSQLVTAALMLYLV